MPPPRLASLSSIAQPSRSGPFRFVFVNADAGALALRTLTSDIRPPTDQPNADLKGYEYRTRYTYDMNCNWKTWAENAIECYHCPTTHPRQLRQEL